MLMSESPQDEPGRRRFPLHGWLGLLMIAVVWPLNWGLPGLRTHLLFFPLWLGYCLTVDGLGLRLRGTSLLARDRKMYVLLFVASVPLWWVFEALNLRTQNWHYVGREAFSDLEYALLASLAFSTVVPAVMGTAELVAGSNFVQRFLRAPVEKPGGRGAPVMLATGLAMLGLLLTWPRIFFPLVWLSLFFILDPLNYRLGNRSLLASTRKGDWRPIVALGSGALICGFFWEMWNILAYPKWVYMVPWFGFWHLFEMPLLGYLGYIPFALELFAAVHLMLGFVGRGGTDYISSGLGGRQQQ